MVDNKHWNLADILKVFLFYFFMMLVGIPVFLRIFKQVSGLDLVTIFGQNTVLLSLSLFVNLLTCLYVFYIIRTGYGIPVTSLGLTTRNWKSDIRFGLKYYLCVLPVIIIAGFVVDFISRMFGIVPERQKIINNILNEDSQGVLAFMIFFGMLAAPVVEEFLFRGFLQPAARDAFGRLKAVLFSGFLFALVHLNAHVFLQIFILGLLLAYLFEKTGSLIAPITVHVCHNTATLAFLISSRHFMESYV